MPIFLSFLLVLCVLFVLFSDTSLVSFLHGKASYFLVPQGQERSVHAYLFNVLILQIFVVHIASFFSLSFSSVVVTALYFRVSLICWAFGYLLMHLFFYKDRPLNFNRILFFRQCWQKLSLLSAKPPSSTFQHHQLSANGVVCFSTPTQTPSPKLPPTLGFLHILFCSFDQHYSTFSC